MKRFALAALAVLTLFGLASCDLLGSTSNSSTAPAGANLSQWWIKGSFDNWTGVGDQAAITATDTVHFMTIDSLNPNLLTYQISVPAGLKTFTYQFVVMNDGAAGSRINFQAPSSTAYVDNTEYTLVPSTTAGASNVSFVASATTYTVQVDITTPSAPKLKLIPGSTASVHYTAAELASNLKMAGGALSMGWTETAGTFDGTNKVTWTNVGTTAQTSPVYFHGDVGYFKSAGPVASPQTIGSFVTAALSGTSDQNLTGIPFSDAKYTFEVTIDSNATSFGAAFTLKVTLTAGSTPWTFTPWATVVFNGSIDDGVNWPSGLAFTETSSGSHVWTYGFTAAGASVQFKPGITGWGDSTNNVIEGAGSLTISGIGTGNLQVTTTSGLHYTITVDMTPASFTTNGTPTVTVVQQ